jgi:hypothetical protein
MNSNALTQTADIPIEICMDTALMRLSAYIDDEIGSLADLLSLTGDETAIEDIRALHSLHLNAGATPIDVLQLLEHAHTSLNRLLAIVSGLSSQVSTIEQAPSDFSAWQRWSGARLQDITTTLSYALKG